MMVSNYGQPHPVVRDFFEGRGWKTLCDSPGEGLIWVVRTHDRLNTLQGERKLFEKLLEAGLNPPAPSHGADEYVIADRVEVRDNGTLVFSLGSPQANVSVKAYAHGSWIEFHLLSEPKEIAARTATMYDPEADDE